MKDNTTSTASKEKGGDAGAAIFLLIIICVLCFWPFGSKSKTPVMPYRPQAAPVAVPSGSGYDSMMRQQREQHSSYLQELNRQNTEAKLDRINLEESHTKAMNRIMDSTTAGNPYMR